MAKIIISGGSGLIGKTLTKRLMGDGHDVSWLTRKLVTGSIAKQIEWDYRSEKIVAGLLENTDILIHLAGAGVMDQRWTKKYKKELVDSRVASLQFLYRVFERNGSFPRVLVCAGGVGLYGLESEQITVTENSPAGTDFLSELCVAWESAARLFEQQGCRLVIARTAVVLSKHGGAFPSLSKIHHFRLSLRLGSGKHYFPWIHEHDLIQFFYTAATNEQFSGAYNLVAPHIICNGALDSAFSNHSKKNPLFPGAPAWLLNLVLGERASTLVFGLPVSSSRLETSGFQFKFTRLETALADLMFS